MVKQKTLYVVNGISGSGKTTYALNNYEKYNAAFYSPDNKKYSLNQEGLNLMIETSEGDPKWRKALIARYRRYYGKIICIYIKTSVEQATLNIKLRNKKIEDNINNDFEVYSDENTALNQFKYFEEPSILEGFDEIWIINNKGD